MIKRFHYNTTDDDVAGFTHRRIRWVNQRRRDWNHRHLHFVLNAQPAENVVLSMTSSDTGEVNRNQPSNLYSSELGTRSNRDRHWCRRQHH